MNIVFMGAPDFAVPSLEALADSSHTISAVVSHPDKKRGRGGRSRPTPVKKRAEQSGLPVIELTSMDDPEFAKRLEELQPDLFVVVAFRILPSELLRIPKYGSVNLHASLLPKYRGAAPIHWAVINGETETGCTVFMLNEKVDNGAVVRQRKTEIGSEETTGDVYERLMYLGADLLSETVDDIGRNDYELHKQDESLASRAPKIFRDDARINFNRPSLNVHNHIRGMSPKPCAWALLDGEELKIYRSRPADSELKEGEPGNLHAHGNRLLVDTRDGAVELTKLQPQNKKPINGSDFINGYEVDQLQLQ